MVGVPLALHGCAEPVHAAHARVTSLTLNSYMSRNFLDRKLHIPSIAVY